MYVLDLCESNFMVAVLTSKISYTVCHTKLD